MSKAVLLLVGASILVILLTLRAYRTEYHEFMQSIDRTMGYNGQSPGDADLRAQGPPYKDNSEFPVPDLTPLDKLTPSEQSRL